MRKEEKSGRKGDNKERHQHKHNTNTLSLPDVNPVVQELQPQPHGLVRKLRVEHSLVFVVVSSGVCVDDGVWRRCGVVETEEEKTFQGTSGNNLWSRCWL